MSHTVPAVGAAAVTAAGCVWYLPALADLRAGDDRPHSTRLAALACLTWWLGTAAASALLLTPVPGRWALSTTAGGALAAGALRLAAAVRRRAEQREEARRWAAVRPAGARPVPTVRPRAALLGWLVAGSAAASVATAVLLAAGRAHPVPAPAVAACAAAAAALGTVLAVTAARSRP
ncbi:hypothetical protein [Kitasatospora sp. KL5]|uniref:hypothetical protein n=1 Tax=Kitasatospora sp. KL5 TaxID=3425125 RepID=UPI003D6DAEBC